MDTDQTINFLELESAEYRIKVPLYTKIQYKYIHIVLLITF